MKEKISEEEMVRRLREVTADEDKYFPGVLGNPVIYAARYGLTLSKSYREFKAKELRALKRRIGKSKRARAASKI